jgi:hypothetical protein
VNPRMPGEQRYERLGMGESLDHLSIPQLCVLVDPPRNEYRPVTESRVPTDQPALRASFG